MRADGQHKLLLVDDDTDLLRLLSLRLKASGYRVSTAETAEAALTRLAVERFSLVLSDVRLPDRDGLAVVHRLALESGASIIIISGRAQVQDRVTGLELGADDYIIKPFDPSEVVARVRARLRKSRPEPDRGGQVARFNGWTAQFDRYLLIAADGAEVAFSHAEGEVLRLFLESPKRLISRAQMQESLGGAAGESFDRAMDVRISRLRTKLGEDPKNPTLIKTIYGAGYIFLGDVVWE